MKITLNVAFEFWHFSPIFVLLKLTCLVTLFDRKLQVFKNSPKWTTFDIFSRPKVNSKCRVFENLKLAVKQCYQTGQF